MKFGILRFPGTCDERDAAGAVGRLDGVEAEILPHHDRDLRGVDAVIVPGGFSYGDYLRTGAIARFAPVMESVTEFAAAGGIVLGICNGFQILCEAGLLPGALLPNPSLRFLFRQVRLSVVDPECAFTNACPLTLSVPVKHTTGRYYSPDPVDVVFKYAPGENPNGSQDDIAGVRNAAGNVLGLMPHPEHAVDPLCGGSADGLTIFASIAAHLRASASTPATPAG
ncbi:phosphoribosylformylglycinamidine synthase subunit PurQ [Conexibacter sp. DBS9H8]|uniref:phosphoribosylformylglycinamidine synthase subunit PurQ n=1 Tax=Conexibacter sp. DBS9H8 TaxID=2937801 RepID=UPI00200EEEE1|nr:phosphoribosylformylglycinamidine synthase subunit PurQ [Conexibacter sp. DBS9H8]